AASEQRERERRRERAGQGRDMHAASIPRPARATRGGTVMAVDENIQLGSRRALLMAPAAYGGAMSAWK
ncbi:MAG TPA: hypothetical protein VNM90_28170, partial [Haliangium sp.]|nr:hypothetical protein [Haliangium sp.]